MTTKTSQSSKTPKKTHAELVAEAEKKTVQMEDGRTLFDRNCWKAEEHTAHTWKSFSLTDYPDSDNAFCDGSGVIPEPLYPSTYTYVPKVKKDYSLDPDNFPVSDPITVAQARKIAYDMHKDDKDKSGEPYRLHLNAVEKGVVLFGGTDEERVAALFHDAVEDDHTTSALLKKLNLTEHTIKTIEAVSKRHGEVQTDYLTRVIKAGESAMRVKLADLIHNTRHDRMAALNEHTRNRLLKKYRPSMARLLLELGIIATEDTQSKLATTPVGSAGHWAGSGWGSSTGKKSTPKPTLSKDAPKPQSFAHGSVVVGDWITTQQAPVVKKDVSQDVNTVGFILANGEYVTFPKRDGSKDTRFDIYPATVWTVDPRVTFKGVAEDDIADYMEVIDRIKSGLEF